MSKLRPHPLQSMPKSQTTPKPILSQKSQTTTKLPLTTPQRLRPILYLITDRKTLPKTLPLPKIESNSAYTALINQLTLAAQAGIDYIQIREKDLSAQSLCRLTDEIIKAVATTKTRVLINDRVDIALACGAHGVHLPANGLEIAKVRKLAGKDFIIGISTHSEDEVLAAQAAGADYVLFGPIFATPSKLQYGKPLGLERLATLIPQTSLPIFALGGIEQDNLHQVIAAGAKGIAAIRLFQNSEQNTDQLLSLIDLVQNSYAQ